MNDFIEDAAVTVEIGNVIYYNNSPIRITKVNRNYRLHFIRMWYEGVYPGQKGGEIIVPKLYILCFLEERKLNELVPFKDRVVGGDGSIRLVKTKSCTINQKADSTGIKFHYVVRLENGARIDCSDPQATVPVVG